MTTCKDQGRGDGADGSRHLRLVEHGSDAAAAARVGARIYVAADGGPIRTIMGDFHSHFVGEEHSTKTQTSHPYEGRCEHALIVESELRADVLAYRTQYGRLRFPFDGGTAEWIIDHLRHVRDPDGDFVEALECKPTPAHLDALERAKLEAAFRVGGGLGWRCRVVYERGVIGGGERQINFGQIYAHQTAHVPDDRRDAFEALAVVEPASTFRRLRETLHADRVQGTAMAHRLVCEGRVAFDLDAVLCGRSRVGLLPAPEFTSLIDL